MKLRRPPLSVDPAAPFKSSLFAREAVAKSLTSLIRKSTDGMVVLVNAPWGAGKTTFSKMWQASLQKEGLRSIAFDAYASDFVEDPFLSFTSEILGLLKRELDEASGVEETTRKFRDAAFNLTKAALPVAAKIALKLGTLGAVGASDLGALADAVKGVGDDVADAAGEAIQAGLEKLEHQKTALSRFRSTLAEVADLMREQHGFPLTIIVDELDRCRPAFALGLLERIKHLFDVPGVVFVLLVNQSQIENYVRCVYGEQVDAPTYLHKFADLFVDLPLERLSHNHGGGFADFYRPLLEDLEVEAENPAIAAHDMEVLAGHFALTLRDGEHVARIIALDRAAASQNDFAAYPVPEFFAVLKVKRPRIFEDIKSSRISGSDVVAQLRLEVLAERCGGSRAEGIYMVIAALIHVENVDQNQETKFEAVNHYVRRFNRGTRRDESLAAVVCRRLSMFRFA